MTASHATGLGAPKPLGKKALFQPPKIGKTEYKTSKMNKNNKQKKIRNIKPNNKSSQGPKKLKRVRTTIDLTAKALQIIDHVQLQHRLKTGKALPLWQAVSQAIENYGKD